MNSYNIKSVWLTFHQMLFNIPIAVLSEDNRRQAITWINDDLVYWRIYAWDQWVNPSFHFNASYMWTTCIEVHFLFGNLSFVLTVFF